MNGLRNAEARNWPGALPAVLLFCVALISPTIAAEPNTAVAGRKASRPNIVVIMADDMGFSDLGCYGSEISTPNLDRLASKGLRFTQFYNTARCCPSRASLLTGLYSHQAGVGHMVADYGVPGYRGFLNDRCATVAELLRDAGYATMMSGKWHVGEDRPHWPVDRGFERSYALVSGGTNYFRLDPGRKLARDDKPIQPDPGWYVTDAITDNAVKFLADPPGKPFFMYVAYTAPHWPLHAYPEDIAKYKGKYNIGWDELRQRRLKREIELGIIDPKWALTPRDPNVPAWEDAPNKEDWDLRMAVYAAQIERMDRGIGRILNRLREMGAEKNTLVLFLADNGGCAEIIDRGKPGVPAGDADSFLSYGVGWANASNTPFRRYKHWVHEGGIASPFIAVWPDIIKKPGKTGEVGHIIDITATCLDAAGVEHPKTYHDKEITSLEGKSLAPIFRGGKLPERPLFWEHEGNRAVRLGKWKLVARHRGVWELYDLEADRTELNDLASANPQKVAELSRLHADWAKRCGVLPWPVQQNRQSGASTGGG